MSELELFNSSRIQHSFILVEFRPSHEGAGRDNDLYILRFSLQVAIRYR